MTHPVSSSLPTERRSLGRKQRGHHPPGPLWSTATRNTLKWTQRWETSSFRETNKPLDLAQEMSSLTMNIVGKALFGTDLSAETERVGRALTTVNHLLAEAFYLL